MILIWILTGMFLITFSIRFAFLAAAGEIKFSERSKSLLDFVPPCVLTAIIVPGVLLKADKQLFLSLDNHFLITACVATAVSLITKNLLFTIVVSMGVYFGLIYNALEFIVNIQ